jgi:hypothetical protein
MSDLTESKIMDGNIAYFKFNKGAERSATATTRLTCPKTSTTF